MASSKLTLGIDTEAVKGWLEKSDMVPVVRCKDCEYWKHHSAVLDHDYCELTSTECEGDHFCSWGEKKDDE